MKGCACWDEKRGSLFVETFIWGSKALGSRVSGRGFSSGPCVWYLELRVWGLQLKDSDSRLSDFHHKGPVASPQAPSEAVIRG